MSMWNAIHHSEGGIDKKFTAEYEFFNFLERIATKHKNWLNRQCRHPSRRHIRQLLLANSD